MLKKVSGDAFIKEGEIRTPINFNPGLNVVLGGEIGDNSIGKSTFLMIIDFVFGGDDYPKKEAIAIKNVGNHTIKFEFEFNGKSYFFTRSTGDSNTVKLCNENYEPLQKWQIGESRKFLAKKYGMNTSGDSFRSVVSPFGRIARRETFSVEEPLKHYGTESKTDQIQCLLKLYGRYDTIYELKKIKDIDTENLSVFNKANKNKLIPVTKNKTEWNEKDIQIHKLESEIDDLKYESSIGGLDLNSVKAQRLIEIRDELAIVRGMKAKLESQLIMINSNKKASRKKFAKDYKRLKYFFPNVDIEKIQQVEGFHKGLVKILRNEFKESERIIQAKISSVEAKMSELNNKIIEIRAESNVQSAILDRYADKKKQLDKLVTANDNYEKLVSLKERKKESASKLTEITNEEIADIQASLNREMDKLNTEICHDNQVSAPTIQFESSSKYRLYTPNDNGSGTSNKGLIIFDIACLNSSELPYIIHDSVMFSEISFDRVSEIINIYTQISKQVFIAIDGISKYSTDAQQKIKNNTVLKLEKNGNELFGKSWGIKENE